MFLANLSSDAYLITIHKPKKVTILHKLFTDTFRVEWNVQGFLATELSISLKFKFFQIFQKKQLDTEGTLDWDFLTHQPQTTSSYIPDIWTST